MLPELPRSEFVFSTKTGRLIVPNPHPAAQDDDGFAVPGDLTRAWDFSHSGAERSLDESRARVGVDAIDIAFVNDPDQAYPGAREESIAALAAMKRAGLIRAIGVGTNATDGLAALIEQSAIDVVMLAYRFTLLDQQALHAVLEPAARAGIAVIAVGIYGSGLLSTPRPAVDAVYEHQSADP